MWNGAKAVESVQTIVNALSCRGQRTLADIAGQDRDGNRRTSCRSAARLLRQESQRPGFFPGRTSRDPHHKFGASGTAPLRIEAGQDVIAEKVDLGGVPEQAVGDGRGMLYVVMQDAQGSVTAVDAKTMKAVAHYPFGDKGRCNGLALDAKNHVLFAACGNSGNPPAQPPQPMMVVLSAADGKILANLPLAGGSDGAAFNPSTMEAFSTHGNGTLTVVKEKSPASFEVEQNLDTMNGARTIAFDSKTNHIFTMSQERGPAPPPPADGGRPRFGPPVPGSFTILMIGK